MPVVKQIKASLTPQRVANLKAEDAEKYFGLDDNGLEVTVDYNFGADTAELVDKVGDAVVYNNAIGHILFTAQSIIRNMLAAGKTSAEIQAHFDKWIPGETPTRKTPAEKERDRLLKLSPEAQAEEIKRMKEMFKALG